EDNRINLRLIAPPRGPIVDRFGEPLAVNDQNFRVVMVPEEAGDVHAVLARVAEVVPLTETDLRRITRDMGRQRAFAPVGLTDALDWEQVSWIEVNAPELPGLSLEVGESRRYPYGQAAAHVLGYVGVVSEGDLNGDPVLTLPGFR